MWLVVGICQYITVNTNYIRMTYVERSCEWKENTTYKVYTDLINLPPFPTANDRGVCRIVKLQTLFQILTILLIFSQMRAGNQSVRTGTMLTVTQCFREHSWL